VADDSEPLRLVTGWSVPDLDARPLWRRSRELSFKRGTGLPGDAWDTGQISLAPNYRDYPTTAPRYEVSAELGLEAALAIPIPIGDPESVLAVAEFHTLSFEAQSEELMALLAAFADQLGTFIARRRAEAKSAEAERFRQHLAEVVRGTQDAVLSKDLDGIVTTWNPAAARLYGYTAEEAIGRHVSFLVPPDHKPDARADRRLGGRPRHHRRGAAPPGPGVPGRRQPPPRHLARPDGDGADDRQHRGARAG
jgi:PAS domain-containing protein